MGLQDGVAADAGFSRQPQGDLSQTTDDRKVAYVSRKLLLLCLIYIALAALFWPSVYWRVTLLYVFQLIMWGPFSCLAVIVPAAVIVSPRAPIGFIKTSLRSNGLRAALVVTVFVLSLSAFTTYKVNIPGIMPFYSDKALADIGEFLHGQAPWRIAHAFDSDTLAMLVALTYSKVWFVEWFGMVFFAALFANQLVHLRYLTALAFVTMAVGTFLATLFSSVGPIFYDQFLGGHRYVELLEILKRRPSNEHVLLYSDYLLGSYQANRPDLGTGISAMPSMHVAVATLNAFYLARLSRWLGAAGWMFAIFILFGSIYTGWHYAVDSYIAMLVVTVIWRRTAAIFDGLPRVPNPTAGALHPSPAALAANPA
ncbi:hypothetical protein DPM33_09190 [Mesorhizobium hawassense]|uniref:Inositolphosphotransferase Aur1/Ipt1 domain-containing protein n=1 Tax=Mesorhizobium hawassense TaxID=1209954 RepID=A0A330HWR3_9HYPH|nr:phosphatase PAP2 family protein [Mesorhizobium hawassense]RAZ91444.1 hypothetical protein DPM33_09190 [Mesorhizobium hawassense]